MTVLLAGTVFVSHDAQGVVREGGVDSCIDVHVPSVIAVNACVHVTLSIVNLLEEITGIVGLPRGSLRVSLW